MISPIDGGVIMVWNCRSRKGFACVFQSRLLSLRYVLWLGFLGFSLNDLCVCWTAGQPLDFCKNTQTHGKE